MNNTGTNIKALNIIHKGMLAGQILFAAVCIYIVYTNVTITRAEELDRILQVMAITLAVAGFWGATTLFKKKLLQARDMQGDAKEKFTVYRSACIIQWAFIEVPCLFSIICFFITANAAFIALSAVLILLFAMTAPSKTKIAFQLGISEEAIEEL